jgi:hypothetical protein
MRSLGCLCLALALSGCSTADRWSKPGVSPEAAARDYSECLHSAELAQRRDREIDADILASRSGDWMRNDVLWLKRNDYADSNSARSGDFVERCMLGKGYSAGG